MFVNSRMNKKPLKTLKLNVSYTRDNQVEDLIKKIELTPYNKIEDISFNTKKTTKKPTEGDRRSREPLAKQRKPRKYTFNIKKELNTYKSFLELNDNQNEEQKKKIEDYFYNKLIKDIIKNKNFNLDKFIIKADIKDYNKTEYKFINILIDYLNKINKFNNTYISKSQLKIQKDNQKSFKKETKRLKLKYGDKYDDDYQNYKKNIYQLVVLYFELVSATNIKNKLTNYKYILSKQDVIILLNDANSKYLIAKDKYLLSNDDDDKAEMEKLRSRVIYYTSLKYDAKKREIVNDYFNNDGIIKDEMQKLRLNLINSSEQDIFQYNNYLGIFTIENEKEKLIKVKPQKFKDSKYSHCLLSPILKWAENTLNDSKSDSSKKRYKTIIKKLNNYIEIYDLGIPEEDINIICDDLKIDIYITLPFDNLYKDYKCSTKPLKKFTFKNTRFNHLEIGNITFDTLPIKKTQEEMNEIINKLNEDNEYYEYEKYNKNIYTITTINQKYTSTDNELKDIYNEFEKDTGLNNIKIDDIDDKEISEFVRKGVHYNGTVDFTNISKKDVMKNKYRLGHIDMEKAYINYKLCKYYDGFLGKITDYRKTNKIMGVGLYLIDNLNFTNCSKKFIEFNEKLGFIYRNNNIYTSPELKYLNDNGVIYDILGGCWGHSNFDFDFSDKMKENDKDGIKLYAKYTGSINSHNLKKKIYIKTDEDFNDIISNSYKDNDDIHIYENELFITYDKKHNYHLSHITAFILAYQRLNFLEQLNEFKPSQIYRVCVDGIYYFDEKINVNLKNCFRIKKDLNLNNEQNLEGYISNYNYDKINIYDKQRENYKNELHLGAGGSGKTTKILRDKGFIKPLFITPSWKLGRVKEKEENINITVYHRLLCDPEIMADIYKNYNVLIIDECSMITENEKKLILKTYKLCKIIFCGDLGYQIEPYYENDKNKTKEENLKNKFNRREMNNEGFEYVENHLFNYRCKCDKLKEILNTLREYISLNTSAQIIRDYIYNVFNDYGRIININDLKKIYKCEDMILTTTNDFKNKYNEIFKDMNKYYITSTNRTYSNGEIVISDNKPVGVNSEIRHAFTCHSIQGETAYDNLFIDINDCFFGNRLLYTAISRAQYLEQIFLIA